MGTNPLMARVSVPSEFGGLRVPSGWFRVSQEMALHKLRALFDERGNNFLPDWLRADLFEHHYRELQGRLELLEGALVAGEGEL